MEAKRFEPHFQGLLSKEKQKCFNELKGNERFMKFAHFCCNVVIVTKDFGAIFFDPNIWTLAQWLTAKALFSDKEIVFIVKPRQAGITTLLLAYDYFCLATLPHLRGILAGSDWEQIKTPIYLFREMYKNLPSHMKLRRTENNVMRQAFSNGNFIIFKYPSSRISQYGKKGRGEALNYAHITEAAFFANEEDLGSIEASFSSHYPYRKYIYESTPNGFNFYFSRYQASKQDPNAYPLLLGWYHVDFYRLTNKEHIEKFSKPLFTWEDDKLKEIKENYGYEIKLEQLAWWHRKAAFMGEESALKEFPWTEEDAFAGSSKSFFPKDKVIKFEEMIKPPEHAFNVYTGKTWKQLTLEPNSFGLLKVWEHWDKRDRYAKYFIGIDPAYSLSPQSDKSCIQVIKCYRDKIYQVAEYAYNLIDTRGLAILALVLSAYYDATVNCEVQGGGGTVLYALQDYWRQIQVIPDSELSNDLRKVKTAALKEYIYRRRDSLRFAAAKHVYTTHDIKQKMLGMVVEALKNEELIIRSRQLYDELKNFIIEEGDYVYVGKGSGDRTMALSLAVLSSRDIPSEFSEQEAQEKNKQIVKENTIMEVYNKSIYEKWISELRSY
jgi:hypothetical protein